MPSKIDYLKEIDIFDQFDAEEIDALASITHLKDFEPKELIFTSDDLEGKIYMLKKGEVTVHALDENGKRAVIDVLKPGAIFGDLSESGEAPIDQEIYAEASADGHLCVCSRQEFFDLLETKPNVFVKIITQLANKLRFAEGKIKDLALSDAKTRIFNTLRRFGQENGQEQGGKTYLNQRLTHAQIAEMTGLTRETVTKCLNSLKKEGKILQGNDKHLVVRHSDLD